MHVPGRLQPLVDQGIIEAVLRPLMAGKEAEVYLVESEGELRVAKIYKDAAHRSFKHRAQYTEGRGTRSTRDQRAMKARSRYGRAREEAAWRNAEVDAIYRLRAAGVPVPEPFAYVEDVLVMELIRGEDGKPAPRLVDVAFEPEEAEALFQTLLREVVKMLCAGVVHGDLSDFNVLLAPEGPVLIDFPQAVDPASNRNARNLLLRDVRNLTSFLARYAPELKKKRYGEEMWALYEKNALQPDTRLTGRVRNERRRANTESVLDEIAASVREELARRKALGLPPPRARQPVVQGPPPKPLPPETKGRKGKRKREAEGRPERGQGRQPRPAEPAPLDDLDALLLVED